MWGHQHFHFNTSFFFFQRWIDSIVFINTVFSINRKINISVGRWKTIIKTLFCFRQWEICNYLNDSECCFWMLNVDCFNDDCSVPIQMFCHQVIYCLCVLLWSSLREVGRDRLLLKHRTSKKKFTTDSNEHTPTLFDFR